MKLQINIFLVIIILFHVVLIGCSQTEEKMKIENELFGKLKSGEEVRLLTIKNADGSKAEFTNFGAAVVSVHVPDKDGNIENVVLGFDNVSQYENIRGFYGATVGRYGNRIGSVQKIR